MSADVLERLRAADPARDVDPAAPDALLEQLLATPRPTPRRRRRRALILVPVAVAAACAAVLIPGTKTDLAARAYAQTAPAGDRILYVRTTIDTTMRGPTVSRDTHALTDRWQQGDRWHVRTANDGIVIEETRGADGILRISDGKTTVDATGDEMRGYIAERESGFIEEFRKRYEGGTLDESGTATFDGRPARRYVFSDEDGNLHEFFLDAETGLPLGAIETFTARSRGAGTFIVTTRVRALEQLPPTPENLAKLNPLGGQGPSGLPISQWWPNGSTTRPRRQPCSSVAAITGVAPASTARASAASGSSTISSIRTVPPPTVSGLKLKCSGDSSATQKVASSPIESWATIDSSPTR